MASSHQWRLTLTSLALLMAAILLSTSTTAHASTPLGHFELHRPKKGLPGLRMCKHTRYPALCVSMAKSVGTGGRAPTLSSLTRASIRAGIARTRHAKVLTSYGLNSKSSDAMLRANFKVCQEMYDDAIDNLNKSIVNLKTRSLDDLKINLSAVITDYVTCEDGFTENPGGRSPLAKVNGALHQLTSNTLALATKLPRY